MAATRLHFGRGPLLIRRIAAIPITFGMGIIILDAEAPVMRLGGIALIGLSVAILVKLVSTGVYVREDELVARWGFRQVAAPLSMVSNLKIERVVVLGLPATRLQIELTDGDAISVNSVTWYRDREVWLGHSDGVGVADVQLKLLNRLSHQLQDYGAASLDHG